MPKTQTKRRSCDGKGKYPTRQAAQDGMQTYIDQSGAYPEGMTTYPCGFGDHWHYGHKGRRRR